MRLLLGAVLQVADHLVGLVELIGALAGVVEQLGIERRTVKKRTRRGGSNRVGLIQVCVKPPDLVLDDGAAQIDVQIVIRREAITVGADHRARAGRRLIGGEIAALERVILVIVVQAHAGVVAAALTDKLRQHAGLRHFGRVGGRADEHLFERTSPDRSPRLRCLRSC